MQDCHLLTAKNVAIPFFAGEQKTVSPSIFCWFCRCNYRRNTLTDSKERLHICIKFIPNVRFTIKATNLHCGYSNRRFKVILYCKEYLYSCEKNQFIHTHSKFLLRIRKISFPKIEPSNQFRIYFQQRIDRHEANVFHKPTSPS